MPGIFEADLVDEVRDVNQKDAERFMRKMAREEGVFAGVSSGAAAMVAADVAAQNPGAVVVCIICDRGDRYLSTGLFGQPD
jgi:cysteine synthase B